MRDAFDRNCMSEFCCKAMMRLRKGRWSVFAAALMLSISLLAEAIAQPEVDVFEGATAGGPPVSSGSVVDFGSFDRVDGLGIPRVFRLENNGTSDMAILSQDITTLGFTVVDEVFTPMTAGDADAFTLRFLIHRRGTHVGNYSIDQDDVNGKADLDENPYVINMVGRVVPQSGEAPALVEDAKLIPSPGAASRDEFGVSMATDGVRVIVGSPQQKPPRTGPNNSPGRVVVFGRQGEGFFQEAILPMPDAVEVASFGTTVDIDGDTAIVGDQLAPLTLGTNGNSNGDGRVFVYTKSGSSWSHAATLATSVPGGGFGQSIAIDGDTIAIGAEGTVVIYTGSGSNWTQRTEITNSALESQTFFIGSSVALDAGTLITGTFDLETAGGSTRLHGRAAVYTGSGANWTEQAILIPDSSEPAPVPGFLNTEFFGFSVDVEGDRAIVGAPGDASFRGSVYVFERSAGVWSKQAKLSTIDAESSSFDIDFDFNFTETAVGDWLGWDVSLRGDAILAGESRFGVFGGPSRPGRAARFDFNGSQWNETAVLTPTEKARASLGTSVALGPDFMIVGGPSGTSGGVEFSGAVYAYNLDSHISVRLADAYIEPVVFLSRGVQGRDDIPGSDFTVVQFGSGAAGAPPATQTFIVENNGPIAINITEVQMPSGYTLSEGLDAVIAAGDSDAMTITLTDPSVDADVQYINIISDAVNAPNFRFAASGEPVAVTGAGPAWGKYD